MGQQGDQLIRLQAASDPKKRLEFSIWPRKFWQDYFITQFGWGLPLSKPTMQKWDGFCRSRLAWPRRLAMELSRCPTGILKQ
jgi:hypothetical protein